MKLIIQKWGNSAALRLPAPMLAQLGVKVGDSFDVEVVKGTVTLRPAMPKTLRREDAAIEALKYALTADEGIEFLRCWMYGDFYSIRNQWPEAPEVIFFGADPLLIRKIQTEETRMTKHITISPSPTNPGIEVVYGLTIKRHVPYSTTAVTLEFSPSIVEHKPEDDQSGVQVRQVTVTEGNDETVSHLFDMHGDKKHTVQANETIYDIELVNITGQAPFFEYDLVVTRRESDLGC